MKVMSATPTMKATMHGWAINAYGGPMRLMELRMPTLKPDSVLIQMHSAEVGDWDEHIRTGVWRMDRPFPLVLGLAGAGTVAAVGPNVTRFAENDSVYTCGYPLQDNGAWAEYMQVPESYVARMPTSLNLTEASAVPVVGLTAHETLIDILQVQSGDVLLITGAAGGVGHLAVQIAKRLGARIVATARRQNHDFVRTLGAETVIDYTAEDMIGVIRARYPKGVDKVLNCVAGEMANHAVQVMREGGRMVDLLGSVSVHRPDVEIKRNYIVRADANRLALITDLIDNGGLFVVIQDVFPFKRASDALDAVLAKHVRGKVVLKII